MFLHSNLSLMLRVSFVLQLLHPCTMFLVFKLTWKVVGTLLRRNKCTFEYIQSGLNPRIGGDEYQQEIRT